MKGKPIVWTSVAVALVLILSLVRIRTRTIRQNDSAAIGRLRRLSEAQLTYSSKHPDRGFACSLSDLGEDERYSGYRFVLQCSPHSNGAVSHYQLVAQPIEFGGTGLQTYCTSEEMQIWYDANGSIQNCLSIRKQVAR